MLQFAHLFKINIYVIHTYILTYIHTYIHTLSLSQDSKGRAGAAWEAMLLFKFDAPVWRVSWSVTGNVLAVSSGDHKVTLWKQAVDETWAQISTVEDSPATN